MENITTAELLQQSGREDIRIIDVRSINAYNGWKERNELRGGHIRGAKSLPAKWSRYIDWIEIVRNKDLLPEHKLILYGYDKEETAAVGRIFKKAGYPDVELYHDFLWGFSSNEDLPLDHLSKYRHLVSASWINQLIQTGTAPEYNNEKFVICHGHYQNRKDYEKGHIPGAIEVDSNTLESPETWNRRSPEELKETLEHNGITKDTTVILYGRFSSPDNNDPFPGSSAGHLGAIRCAAIMLYAGVKDVRILNGGLQSWEDEGYEVTKEESVKKPVDDFGADIPVHPEYFVDLEKAQQMTGDPDSNLISMRSWKEYTGEASGYNYIQKKGRIPGSVWGDNGSDAYRMENYRNLDHTTREYHEIEELWAKSGITPDKHNAFYCGTGWRGSEAFLNAWLMGWPRVSVFDGGWFEWSNSGLPYETGMPQEIEKEYG